VSHAESHPSWTLKIEAGYLVPFMQDHGLDTRSQDLSAAYVVNGSFYLISSAELKSERSFLSYTTVPFLVESPEEILDIDTEWDFRLAK
jgi:CMP-N,N'-diacetyllegionaminic acid synthase